MGTSQFVDVQTLPTTGTYTILLDPYGVSTGSVTLTLYNVPADVSGTITPGGSAVTVSTTTPGQNGTLTFGGTAGQRISLLSTNGTYGGFGCNLYVSILKPDASALVGPTCMGTSQFVDVQTLPTTGTYTIRLDPYGVSTGSVTLTLYNVPADVSGAVTVGGPAASITIGTPGQNAAVTFSGTASQQVTVRITSNTIASVTVTLLKPDGSQLTSTWSSASSFNLTTQTLPSTGTYTIVIDPAGTNTGSVNVAVSSP
jgi:hypothetical protein